MKAPLLFIDLKLKTPSASPFRNILILLIRKYVHLDLVPALFYGGLIIMFFSFFTIFGIYYFEFLNIELISTKLLLAQLYLNIIAVIAKYSMRSLQNIKVLGTK